MEALLAAIEDRIDRTPGRPYAVFDFDHTCVTNDVAELVLAHLCRNGLLKCPDLLAGADRKAGSEYHRQVFLHYFELMRKGDIRAASLLCGRLFAGFSYLDAEAVATAVIEGEAGDPGEAELFGIRLKTGLAARPWLHRLFDCLTARAVQIWIVSASPDIVVRVAMKRLAIDAQLIALRNRVDRGVLSMDIEEPHSIDAGKVDCIKAIVDASTRPLLGIGDSVYDLPMLEYATIRAVIDRDPVLTASARHRGWFILNA